MAVRPRTLRHVIIIFFINSARAYLLLLYNPLSKHRLFPRLTLMMLLMVVPQEKRLREENEQLAKNISCLFNTAQAEIARKDKWINQLRLELQVAEDKNRRDRARR